MPRYMLLCYQEDVDPDDQAKREVDLPMMVDLLRDLRESGVLVGVGRLRSVDSATSVRVRDGQTEILDGPFAMTKERLAGYYLVDCPDLDAALELTARLPSARHGTTEVRPVLSPEEWIDAGRHAGADVPEEATRHLR